MIVGHCRRRKIRCLLAPGDPQGRCTNCIRLRRACQFFPVDQQPPTGDGNHGEGSPVEAEASTSSSPIHPAPGAMVEHVEGYPHLQPHPLQTGQDFTAMNPFSASTLSSSGRSKSSACLRLAEANKRQHQRPAQVLIIHQASMNRHRGMELLSQTNRPMDLRWDGVKEKTSQVVFGE